jgi:iron complex transport system permease protein
MSHRRYGLSLLALFLLLLGTMVYSLFVGAVRLSGAELWALLVSWVHSGQNLSPPVDPTTITILFSIRLPRILLALSVGAALSVSGTAFQGFFKNILADPYVIGASSGAALGAAIAMVLNLPPLGPVSSASLFAFVGALGATVLAFAISRASGDPPPAAALLLAGTALSALFSSLLSLVLVARDKDLHRVYYWLLGGLGGTTWAELVYTIPLMVGGCTLVFLAARPLDLLVQGDDVAQALGLNVKRARLVVALGASMAAAAAVASAGIIGFVGLVAPHMVRLLIGPSHGRLLPAAALGGAVLVLLADLIARTAAAPMELPIGIVTSLIGAPFFIYLLVKRGRNLGGQ